MNWSDPNPVFFDIETQSGCDLKEYGGRRYAAHATTRVLTFVAYIDGTYHVWIPDYVPAPAKTVGLWPEELREKFPAGRVAVHHAATPPQALVDAAKAKRLFVAHNCWGFDQFIWREKIAPLIGGVSPPFADSLPVSRAAGLPGGLDKLATMLFGAGKDSGKVILRKYTSMRRSNSGELFYPMPGPGDIAVIARYNVGDVVLLKELWHALEVEVEDDVLDAHLAINDRGVYVDTALAARIRQVAAQSIYRAGAQIEKLTNGELTAADMRSPSKVKRWLSSFGLSIHDHAGRQTLRKDFVERALANPWLMLDEDTPVEAAKDIPPHVFEVLRLRGAALRITGAKTERAILRCDDDSRARDVHTYHQASTGRWSSAGIQVHNMPRAKKGVDIERLLAFAESEWGLDNNDPHAPAKAYDAIAAMLPAGVGVDDALSSLLRPMFRAAPGKALLLADYNAIECRGLAWVAGEEWLLDTFRSQGDPYLAMASRVFGRECTAEDEHERQVGKVIILGCGYSMGIERFRIHCGLSGVDLAKAGTSAEECVEAYRAAHPAIAGRYAGMIGDGMTRGRAYRSGGVWDRYARAATAAVQEGGRHEAGRCAFYCGSESTIDGELGPRSLLVELPSGRKLRYHNIRIEDRVPGYAAALGLDKTKATLVYDGQYGATVLYGGKITENIVQAICRDVLATALIRMHRCPRLPVVLHVHDQIAAEVWEREIDELLPTFAELMVNPPEWAEGFPLAVEAYAAPRFVKSPPKGWPSLKKAA